MLSSAEEWSLGMRLAGMKSGNDTSRDEVWERY